jgi:hypothetical protein
MHWHATEVKQVFGCVLAWLAWIGGAHRLFCPSADPYHRPSVANSRWALSQGQGTCQTLMMLGRRLEGVAQLASAKYPATNLSAVLCVSLGVGFPLIPK